MSRRGWLAGALALAAAVGAQPHLALAGPALPCTTIPTIRDRCESWTAVYDDPTIKTGSDQLAPVLAVSADGKRVFIAAIDETTNPRDPYHDPAKWAVLAYDGATGATLWTSVYEAEGNYDRPNAITTSADGSRVYVTGASYDANPLAPEHRDRDMVTIAYDAASGQRVWTARNRDPSVHDSGVLVRTSPDGAQVYAVANIDAGRGEIDWAAVAYDAVDGHELWRTVYKGLDIGKANVPGGLALSRDGSLIYVTGEGGAVTDYDIDYATVAYATGGAMPGRQVWEARYDGVGRHFPDRAQDVAVDVDGRVIVTGDSVGEFATIVAEDYATVAYDGATGAQLWAARYSGPSGGINFGRVIATSSSQRIAVVSGQSNSSPTAHDSHWATLGYDTGTGRQLWVQRFTTPAYSSEWAEALAISPDGQTAFVTGFSGGINPTPYSNFNGGDGVTIAYRVADGTQQWIARYNPSPSDTVDPPAVAVSLDGSAFVTAQLRHNTQTDQSANTYDVATIAYLAPQPGQGVPDGAPWLLLASTMLAVAARVAWRRSRAAPST